MNRRILVTLAAAAASAVAAVSVAMIFGMAAVMRIVPALAMMPAAAYLALSERKAKCSPEALLNEAPTVIGMMSVMVRSRGSMDEAVREVAAKGPKNMAPLFAAIVSDADCRRTDGIRSGLLDMLSSMPSQLSPFRRAVHMLMTAADTSDDVRRAEMVKDAEETVLTGLKQMGESYSSKLNTPCMMIFGLGIMVPMILVSILPMMGMGGSLSAGIAIDPGAVAFITLILIPAVVALTVVSIRSGNPFVRGGQNAGSWKYALPMVSAVPAAMFCMSSGLGVIECVTFSVIPACILTAAAVYPAVASERKRVKAESSLRDALFDLGNRLIAGENYESALTASLAARKDCAGIGEAISRELVMCRGDTESAISMAISPTSAALARTYVDVYRASEKDLRESGRLAVSVAHQLQDQEGIRKAIENKLKSTLDMMTGTAAVFAPLILGMSVMMLAPISQMTGSAGMAGVTAILPIYLVELTALISLLTPALISRGGLDTVFRFSIMAPVSLAIFFVLSGMSV